MFFPWENGYFFNVFPENGWGISKWPCLPGSGTVATEKGGFRMELGNIQRKRVVFFRRCSNLFGESL